MYDWNDIIYENFGSILRFCVFCCLDMKAGIVITRKKLTSLRFFYKKIHLRSRRAYDAAMKSRKVEKFTIHTRKMPECLTFWSKSMVFVFLIFWVRKIWLWSPESFSQVPDSLSRKNTWNPAEHCMLLQKTQNHKLGIYDWKWHKTALKYTFIGILLGFYILGEKVWLWFAEKNSQVSYSLSRKKIWDPAEHMLPLQKTQSQKIWNIWLKLA